MKIHLLSFCAFLMSATTTLSAQIGLNPDPQLLDKGAGIDTAKYKVTYQLTYKNHPSYRDYNTDIRTVQIGKKYVKDFSDIICHFDSLRTADERKGLDTYSSITGEPYPVEITRDITGKNISMKRRMPIRTGNLVYTENAPQFSWKFTNDTDTTIAGYECSKATMRSAGRNYEAWFTSELPLPYGPYKFGGLPGLIMKIQDAEKQFIWEAVAFEKSTEPIMVYEYEDEKKCTPEEADKTVKRLFKAPYTFLMSTGMQLIIRGKDGKDRNAANVEEPELPYKPLELKDTITELETGSLPDISHITEMKMSDDTLLFVYENKNGYGQQFLRRAIIDLSKNKLDISPDMGKRDNGYYISYLPYPFIVDDGSIHVINRDDCEIYTVENDTALISTKQYLMDSNSTIPLTLSQYVTDVFMTSPDKYVFIGREPNGGRQFAMTADLTISKIDTIRQINVSHELQTWMPNIGEMAYSGKHHDRLAFAYRLHPVIDIFRPDGSLIKNVKFAEPTFDPSTLEKADFEELNPIHFIDVTTTDDYIYALHLGHTYAQHQSVGANSSVYKIDWNGNIVNKYHVNADLRKIAAYNDNILIGWTGDKFILIQLV